MHATRLEHLAGRTAIDVLHWIVNKSFIAEDAFLAPRVTCV
jgi:hypothetical protein